MTSPFQAFRPEPPSRIILPCKVCKKEIARSDLAGRDWVHLDDVALFTGDTFAFSQYDHPADPDVIDVEEVP